MISKKAHTPTLLQLEATECGAASLGMILGYHGCFVPLADLRRDCGVSRDGSKASNVVKAATEYGMDGSGYSVEIDDVSTFKTPFIVFWQFNHFLVVEGFSKDHVFLNDPAMGHRKVDNKEFDDGFTGIVITFEKNENFRKLGSPPRALPSILTRLKPQRGPILQALLCGLLLVAPALLVPACTAIFVDEVLGGMRVNWFRPLLLTLAIAMVVQFIVKVVQLQIYRRLRTALYAAFSGQFQWHLLRLPLGFYAQRYPGEIANRARLNEDVAEIISTSLVSTGIALVSMLLYGAVLFSYDPVLASIGVLVSAINFIVLKRVSAKRVEENMRLAEVFGRTASVSISALTNIESIKASAQESDTFGRWSGFFTNSMLARQRLETTSMVVGLLPSLLQTLTVMLILVVGGFRVMQGSLTIGELTAFQALMLMFLAPIGRLVGMGTQLQDLQGDLLRLDDVLANEPEPSTDISDIEVHPEDCVRLEGSLDVEDLTFGYSPLEPPIIDDFHFSARPGTKIAFVGGSGSGKSTVAKLIGGLANPWQGKILFDGKERGAYHPGIIRSSLAMVDQDVLVFEGTVRENLSIWDPTVSESSLLRACDDAAILEVVLGLPGGLDAPLLEGGANLSGGQRQRLEIARALLHNPSVLILDEATSALDAETEETILSNLARRGCTCIIIAHRLSTVRDCDEIIVMHRGNVVERGTHQALWDSRGEYRRLVESEEG